MKKYQLGNITVNSLRKVIVYDENCRAYREKHTIKISNGKINKYFTYTTEVINFIDRENFYKTLAEHFGVTKRTITRRFQFYFAKHKKFVDKQK